jgi:hypothetical protein
MKGSPRKGRNRRDGADDDDDERTVYDDVDDERTVYDDVDDERTVYDDVDDIGNNIVTDLFIYVCGCNQIFVVQKKDLSLLHKHRKKCKKEVSFEINERLNIPRGDDYNEVVLLLKNSKSKEVIEGFKVYFATVEKLVTILYNNNYNDEMIIEYFYKMVPKSKIKNYLKNVYTYIKY